MGLHDGRELVFLRALTGREPLLCLLRLPAGASPQGWLQQTWEGLTSWSFRSAQRFIRAPSGEGSAPEVRIGPEAMLHGFLKPSAIGSEGSSLALQSHSLNLIASGAVAQSTSS
ncbi:hypothetical protein [Archangium lansingense]|uniref:Uncharacterized protein n=1 Tax=Archangium lansingense TaxID=2995310 RepID=A0ABT4AFM2_9BACT|nr:hypothetical protein [Archangium lansinium]MCY1079687.1 hypothetical protein [Archangium lansinium]